MRIDPNWTYNETIEHAEAIKSYYKDTLASFLWHEGVKRVLFMRDMKLLIYSLKFEEWRRDKIWAYLNDDEPFLALAKYIPKGRKLDKKEEQ